MYHVIAATTNPAKINAIKLAFEQVFGKDTFDIEDINVDSRVPQQPIGNTETRTGARQRVMAARQVCNSRMIKQLHRLREVTSS